MQLLETKGQKFLHCPGTKGKRDKLKILPRDGGGRDGPGQPVKIRDRTRDRIRDGTVPDFDSLSRPVPQDKTGQSRKGHSETGKGRSKTDLFVGVVTPEDHT